MLIRRDNGYVLCPTTATHRNTAGSRCLTATGLDVSQQVLRHLLLMHRTAAGDHGFAKFRIPRRSNGLSLECDAFRSRAIMRGIETPRKRAILPENKTCDLQSRPVEVAVVEQLYPAFGQLS